MTARDRVERIIVGVLRQALIDASCDGFVVSGHGAARDYAVSLCSAAAAGTKGTGRLRADSACKTELLLGYDAPAHVLPFGDVYFSELAGLVPNPQLHGEAGRLASMFDGALRLDAALDRYFDRRAEWDAAVAELSVPEAAELRGALDAARFRRSLLGIVPKLGPRTLGIDLHA